MQQNISCVGAWLTMDERRIDDERRMPPKHGRKESRCEPAAAQQTYHGPCCLKVAAEQSRDTVPRLLLLYFGQHSRRVWIACCHSPAAAEQDARACCCSSNMSSTPAETLAKCPKNSPKMGRGITLISRRMNTLPSPHCAAAIYLNLRPCGWCVCVCGVCCAKISRGT